MKNKRKNISLKEENYKIIHAFCKSNHIMITQKTISLWEDFIKKELDRSGFIGKINEESIINFFNM